MNISSLEHFKEKFKVRHAPKPKHDVIVKIHDDVDEEDEKSKDEDVDKRKKKAIERK